MQKLLKKCCPISETYTEKDVWINGLISKIENKIPDVVNAMFVGAISGNKKLASANTNKINDMMYIGVLLALRKYYNDDNLLQIDSQLKCIEKIFKCSNISIREIINH